MSPVFYLDPGTGRWTVLAGENQDSWGLCWGISSYQVWYDGAYKDLRDVAECMAM